MSHQQKVDWKRDQERCLSLWRKVRTAQIPRLGGLWASEPGSVPIPSLYSCPSPGVISWAALGARIGLQG